MAMWMTRPTAARVQAKCKVRFRVAGAKRSGAPGGRLLGNRCALPQPPLIHDHAKLDFAFLLARAVGRLRQASICGILSA